MTVNLVDIIFLIPLLLFAWAGFKKGFIIEVATLVALILGLYFAIYFSHIAADFINDNLKIDQKYIGAISFVITFIVVVFGIIAVGNILQKLVDIILLGIFNKIAGAVFGIFKGAIFISVLIYAFAYFGLEEKVFTESARSKSILYQPIKSIAPTIADWLNLEELNIKFPDKKDLIDDVI